MAHRFRRRAAWTSGQGAAQVRRPAPLGDTALRGSGTHDRGREPGTVRAFHGPGAGRWTLKPRRPGLLHRFSGNPGRHLRRTSPWHAFGHGLPARRHPTDASLKAEWNRPETVCQPASRPWTDQNGLVAPDAGADLNICSKEYMIRQYDHEVKGVRAWSSRWWAF